MEKDRALPRRCSWAGGLGRASYLEMICTQSWRWPSSPVRSLSVPIPPSCLQSCAARFLSRLSPSRQGPRFPALRQQFAQHLVSKPAKEAQPPTPGVMQAARALAGRATAALQIPTGAQTAVTDSIKHIRMSRCVAVLRTALLAGCLLWRAFSPIEKAIAVALPAQGPSSRAGSSGTSPANCREAMAAQSRVNGTALLRSHNLPLAQLAIRMLMLTRTCSGMLPMFPARRLPAPPAARQTPTAQAC